MTKLEDLINSLASVIVRYHDTQKDVTKLIIESDQTLLRKKSRSYAIDIMQNMELKFDQRLARLIDACTKKYPDRKPFLTFILKETIFLKEQLDRKVPFTSEELEKLKQQISQLFIDSRQLLKIYKNTSYKITYSSLDDKAITYDDLNGLINDAYYGNHFCNSGDILLDEVLGRFHITIDYTDEEIKEIAAALCIEHQNALLVSELKNQKFELESEQSNLVLQKSELEEQKSTLELQISQLESDKSMLSRQKLELEEHNSTLELQMSELKDEKSTLTHEKTELEEQKSALELQMSQLEDDKSILAHQKSELEAQKSTLKLQVSRLEKDKSTLTHQKSELEMQKSTLKLQVSQLEEDKSTLTHQKSSLESDKSSLTLQKLKLIETNKTQEKTIEELHRDLENTRAELEKTQLEFETFKKQKAEETPFPKRPLPSLYGGLTPFYLLNQHKGTFFRSNLSPEAEIDIVEDTTSRPNVD
ncbi:M protein [Legionella sainthelensi]|uniref:M protein n=1 Tax=Legionella sainthelensi TaxID=28087 RepID=UPI000E1FCB7D|nr:M protein [Legionella sainthelensi]